MNQPLKQTTHMYKINMFIDIDDICRYRKSKSFLCYIAYWHNQLFNTDYPKTWSNYMENMMIIKERLPMELAHSVLIPLMVFLGTTDTTSVLWFMRDQGMKLNAENELSVWYL